MDGKLNAVMIGAGGITPVWLDALAERSDVFISGIVELVPEKAEQRIREYSLNARCFGSLSEALQTCRPDIVFDCSLPSAHCRNAVEALSFGCHVLSEKPVAETSADVRRIIAAAEKAGRIHAVMQNRRYLSGICAYRNAVCGGDIGQLTTLNADFYIGAHFGGFRDVMRHVLLVDMAIHTFDQARFISGCNPVSVYCREWNPPGSWYRGEASAIAIFEMTGGVVFCYRGSWCAEGCSTPWECDWRAVGTQGSVCWTRDGVRGEKVVRTGSFFSEMEPFVREPCRIGPEWHAGCIDEFINCVKRGGVPQTVCTDNILSFSMVEAAVKSAESGMKEVIAEL